MELYRSFYEVALEDFQVSKILLEQNKYPHSVYFLQQSVEKAVKAYGLITGVIEPEDVPQKISHKSYKVFTRLIGVTRANIEKVVENKAMLEDILDVQDQLYLNLEAQLEEVKLTEKKFTHFDEGDFFDLSEEEVQELIQQIEDASNVEIKFSDEQFEQYLIEEIGQSVLENREDIEHAKAFFKKLARMLENQLSAIYTLVYLSLVTFPHNQTTRYPCLTCGETPNELYTENLPLVRNLPKLISLYENSLHLLELFLQDFESEGPLVS